MSVITVKVKIDPERLTINDRIAIEERGNLSWRQLRDLVARFVVNESGEFLEPKDAREAVGELTELQFLSMLGELKAAMDDFSRSLLPLANSSD